MKLCECGCGNPTPIAKRDRKRYGQIKGYPLRFIQGHTFKKHFDVKAHFEENIEMIPECGCWIWLGGTRVRNYGTFFLNGKTELAHRASWMIYKGFIPPKLHVLHRCDTPECVNPYHLFLGTHKDNMADAKKKKRFPFGYVEGRSFAPNYDPRRKRITKLNAESVINIRNDKRKNTVIAKEYGVTASAIGSVKNNKTWRYI